MQNAVEYHTAEAHDAITAELVACTLGQRERLELRVDTPGKLQHAMRQMVAELRDSLRRQSWRWSQ